MLYFVFVENLLMNKYSQTIIFGDNEASTNFYYYQYSSNIPDLMKKFKKSPKPVKKKVIVAWKSQASEDIEEAAE